MDSKLLRSDRMPDRRSSVPPAKEPARKDETVRTTLQRASDRCRRVSQRCVDSVRRPTPGGTDSVDVERLRRIRAPEQEPDEVDPIDRLIARIVGPSS
jgi:hypothetical protein